MTAARKIEAGLLWRVARVSLGRLACEVMDPADQGHDHAACVFDDEAYAADLLLRLIAPAVNGDEDGVLDRMTELLASVKRED